MKLTKTCVPFSPPSTAMTLGIPQANAEGLLEGRKGGDMHISHSVSGTYGKYPLILLVSFLQKHRYFLGDCNGVDYEINIP